MLIQLLHYNDCINCVQCVFWCDAALTQTEIVVCEDILNQEMSDVPLDANNLTYSSESNDSQVHETAMLTELREKVDLNSTSVPAVTTPLSCHANTFLELVYGDFCAVRDSSQESDDDEDDERDKDVTSVTRRIVCVEKTVLDHHTSANTQSNVAAVQLFNSSQLLSHLGLRANSSILGQCSVVLFYAPWCVFCVRLAPYYNALARAFPTLDVIAIDAYHFSR